MNRMMKLLAVVLATTPFVALATACDDHYTTQEAYEACEQLAETNPGVLQPLSFDDCVDCFERCGSECRAQGTAPETFDCPDDTEGEGGGD